jgi:K+-transporting ATPase ATPase C chain
VKYKSGAKAGQLVAPDVEGWFGQDKFQGNTHIVAQWADLQNSIAQAWVNADPKNGAYVDDWTKKHPDIVAKWIKDNPGTPQPKAADLAVLFFETFSGENPGKFPSAVTKKGPDGKDVSMIESVNVGTDIQSIFFDMWRQEHPDADMQDVPGDLVTTSASGLDPHITLQNAEFQLERVATAWAAKKKTDASAIRKDIEKILQKNAAAPWDGLIGEKFVNVLEVNLELRKLYGAP